MECKIPYGFQLKYESSEPWVPLLSQNREIEISASDSKFGAENLKREVVKAVRDKNVTVRLRSRRSQVEIVAEQVIWKCNKKLVFCKFSETVRQLEKEIIDRRNHRRRSLALTKTKFTSGSSDITNKSDSTSKTTEGQSSNTPHATAIDHDSGKPSSGTPHATSTSHGEVKLKTYSHLDVTAIAKIQQHHLQRLNMLLDRGSGPPRTRSGSPDNELTPTLSGSGTSQTPTPTTTASSDMGQSPSASRAKADEVRNTTEMDKLLTDATRRHLVETYRESIIQPVSLRSPESTANDVAVDTTLAQEDDLIKGIKTLSKDQKRYAEVCHLLN